MDGVDWYVFKRSETLRADTIKMTVMTIDGRQIVQAATRDTTAIFPQGSLLLEVAGDNVADPQAAYGQKEFVGGEFREQQAAVPLRSAVIADSARSLQLADAKSLAAQGRTDEALAAVIAILEQAT